jgi:hypothetical protein
MIMISEGFFLNVLLKKNRFFLLILLVTDLLQNKKRKNQAFYLENFQIEKLRFFV